MEHRGLARRVAWGLLLAAVPAASAFADPGPAGAALAAYLRGLPRCGALEFSEDGYLNQLAGAFPELTPDSIDGIIGYTAASFPVPVPQTTRPYEPGEYPHLRWPFNQSFRSDLLGLKAAMEAAGLSRIGTQDLVAIAEDVLDSQLREGGDCYKISVQATMSNDFESAVIVDLDAAAQQQIDAYFRTGTGTGLLAREQAWLDQGLADEAEVRELHALAAATQVFEFNTFLINDVGGYPGNIPVEGQVRTTCRNEMQTYYFFLRRLKRRGLMEHFAVEDRFAYRPSLLDGHDSAVLRSLRTGQLFVVDSWVDRGGYPARILTLADWLARRE